MADVFKPYTYLIGWSKYNKFYYGSRYAKNSNPNDLWKNYFTSSKEVHKFREKYGEPDIIKIRKIFNCREETINWEFNVLKKLKVKSNDKWLNIAIGKPSFLGKKHSNETKKRMSKPKPAGFGENVRKLHLGKKRSEQTKQNISNSKKGLTLRAKKWIFLFENEIVEIINLTRFCKENNLNVSCMRDVYNGIQNQHKNYKRVV